MKQPRVVYFLNGLGRGGAELGLRTMLEHGLFAQVSLRVNVLFRGSEDLRRDIESLIGRENLVEGTLEKKLTVFGTVLGSCKFLYQLIAFRPQVVILSLKQANIIGRFLLYFFPGVRCIAFEHIAHLERGRAVGIYERALRALSNRVDEVWGDCPATLQATREYYRVSPKVQTFVPLFVAPCDAPSKSEYALHSPARIVAASRLVPRKRLDVLLQAIRLVKDNGHKIELTIFGEGPDKDRLERIAAELQIGRIVTVAGFVSEWWRVAAESDMFVHLSEDEGFCITVAEAMVVGLPVIASSVGGIPDYSRDSLDAVHLRSLDPSDVARAIVSLLNDDAKRSELGLAAASNIRSRFAAAPIQRQYKEIATSLLDRASSNGSRKWCNWLV
jgi:glycosyltransferase involved in cell wall biosynthesis